ncbi:hypothetical protein AUJ77_00875 [Candidatus Nomurabacteria bacterium CG1_02_43_90]|uniref:Uncharacterized protein n=1 Tax=Candidatus Nomurabacteria bacterium CG1_02_43_90 TaxID=1805281 RepID=A0A1J4V9S7_9BACT|nr:MAG: hypothetical protein AUJ77_00875 [Candidatus Nomurabacteria bacterium CG1_02_43_90]
MPNTMNKKYFIIVLVIIIAVLLGFFVGKKSAVAPVTGDVVSTGVVVTEATTTPPLSSSAKKSSVVPAPKKSSSNRVVIENGAYVVSYTSYGFRPATLTINAGKSVHFVNNSNKAMSISSADLNSNVYGGLNQSKTVGKGGTYDFTFVAEGNWAYINRNNPGDKGLIIVQ